MDNSVYITLSRQLALFRDMDVTANNIAKLAKVCKPFLLRVTHNVCIIYLHR